MSAFLERTIKKTQRLGLAGLGLAHRLVELNFEQTLTQVRDLATGLIRVVRTGGKELAAELIAEGQSFQSRQLQQPEPSAANPSRRSRSKGIVVKKKNSRARVAA